jgi:hypothetical protein
MAAWCIDDEWERVYGGMEVVVYIEREGMVVKI